jgi:molybdenum cofactor cytidylyltransferase
VRAPTRAGPPHALVLAAGQGRRFGGGKLLASYRGRPLLSHVLDIVVSGCQQGVLGGGHVVLAAEDERARRLTENTGLEPIINDSPHLGLSHSVRLGLSALESDPKDQVDAGLILLGDQPMVRLAVVEALITAWRSGRGPIVRPRYQRSPHVPGHPTLLDRSIWPLAHQLEGDRGFASLLASASVDTFLLDVSGDNPDVDTPADLHALEESPP